jgi:hypothetical protein
MYEVLKSVISAGGYKLADIQHKVKKLYVIGDLTEAQMDELLSIASGGVSTDAERPEVMAMLLSLAERIEALEKKLHESAEPGEETPEHEAWKPWDGMSNKYQHGAIVSHNGKLWQSVFAGQNVWEPGAAGTESLWVEYTAE